jgi:hypothetical protein
MPTKIKKTLKEILNIIEDIFCNNKVVELYYSIKNGIENIINWFPIVWKDRNWDRLYIYILLHHKLRNMEKFFNGYLPYSSPEYTNKINHEIKIAKALCERIIENDYLSNALIPYYKIYSDNDKLMWSEPCNDGTGHYRVIFTEDNKQRKLFRRCGKHADYMEKQDIDYLHRYIAKRGSGWWD